MPEKTSTNMNSEVEEKKLLQEAVERLYEVFARYPLAEQIYGCGHCVSPEDHQRIRSKPLRELTKEDLSRYAHKAMSTWGDEADFKHFLPRLLELLTFVDEWPLTVDRLAAKLEEANWRNWPEPEHIAVEEYLMALWRFGLTNPDHYIYIYDWLWGMARAVDDLEPYLDVWRDECKQSPLAVHHLIEFIDRISFDKTLPFEEDLNDNSKLDDKEDLLDFELQAEMTRKQWKQIAEWLIDTRTRAALEEGSFKYGNEPFGDELTTAVEQLASFSRSK
jgi:hypothetical protein